MKNKFLKLGAVLFATVSLAGCLKDKNFDSGRDGIVFDASQQKVVSLALTTTDTTNVYVTSFDANPAVTEFDLAPVQLAGGVPATQDVHVVLALDSNMVNDYNTANGTTYLNPLPSTFTTSTLTVTIPKGQSKATLKIDLIPANFLGALYAIGVKILSVDGGYQIAAGYKNHGLFVFGVKNAYDGVYRVISGLVTRYTAPGVPQGDALSGSLAGNPNITLTTKGTYADDLTGIQWANAGGGVGGVLPITITVNPVDNTVTSIAGANATFGNWAGHVNSYDPTTRTFHLSWRWNPTSTVREYEFIMQYIGPRP